MSTELDDIPDGDVGVADAAASSAPSQAAPPQSAHQGGQPRAPQGDAGFSTPWEAFKHLPEYQGADDLAIAQDLYRARQGFVESQRQLQQYQQIIPGYQDYLRNQKAYQDWQAAQAEAAKPKAPEQPKWWNPPQVNDSWRNYIVRDPATGKEVIDPSAPWEAQQALRNYQSYTADFARRLVTDPEKTLTPFIEQIATQRAEAMVQQHLGQYKANTYVADLERQNADWLYDQNRQITPEGQALQGYIQQAGEIGISTPEARWRYATGMLQRDLLNARYQQLMAGAQQGMAPQQMQGGAIGYANVGSNMAPPRMPADPVAEQNMRFLRERAVRTPNRSGGTTEPQAPRQRMTFEERLRSQLANDGVI